MASGPLEVRRRKTPDPNAPASPDLTQPLAGVNSEVLTAATRRVARRWRDEIGDPSDPDTIAGLLAALALAVDRRSPGYVAELIPRPSPVVWHQLVEMLRSELVRGWLEAPAAPAAILGTLTALDQVRQAVDSDALQRLAAPLAAGNGLELLIEIMHDLRSPLTSILFLAETLQRGQSGAVNDLQRRQLGLVYSAALGLSSVVSDAIELARGGDELSDGGPSPFSVAELLDSVRSIVSPMAEEKGLSIRLVPPEVDQRVGHPVAISRVLLNLTTNAIRFTDAGFVEIACRPIDAARLEFSVRDSGPGINPDAMGALYHPIRRTVGHGYSFSGTGLGLAICRKLVRAMGAELRLQTNEGVGTRFHFELDVPPAVRA
jgi:signal transduction histidine kinase